MSIKKTMCLDVGVLPFAHRLIMERLSLPIMRLSAANSRTLGNMRFLNHEEVRRFKSDQALLPFFWIAAGRNNVEIIAGRLYRVKTLR